MKIFISWSGERSKVVAKTLHEWIPLVLHFVEPWYSEKNIEAGGRWTVELEKGLQGSDFGLIVITPENLNAPWIIFEAGAISNAFSTAGVCPYLVGLEFKDVSGPLSQFQSKKADRQSTFELLQAINNRATNPLEPIRLSELFDALWPRLETRLLALPPPLEGPLPARSQSEVMEELVEAVRRIDLRLDTLQLRHADLAPYSLEPTRSSRAVRVEIRGQFPGLTSQAMLQFTPKEDLIQEIADVVGVSTAEYGSTWSLRDTSIGCALARSDGPRYAEEARDKSLELLLIRQILRRDTNQWTSD